MKSLAPDDSRNPKSADHMPTPVRLTKPNPGKKFFSISAPHRRANPMHYGK